VIDKLLSAIEDVERNLNGNIEKKVGELIITKLHSFLIQASLTQGSGPSPRPSLLPRVPWNCVD